MLSEDAQRLFDRSSIFRGNFDVHAVTAVAGPALGRLDVVDLLDELDEDDEQRVDFKKLVKKNKSSGFQGVAKTSSKVWEDFNVHKAFTKTLVTAFKFKYPDEAE